MSSSIFARMCGFAATAFLGVALAQAEVQPTRILCYGDSTTWGQVGGSYGDVGGVSYPCLLQNLLGNRYEVKCICLSGSTVADMLVWRGVRELRTKPYYTVKTKTETNSLDHIVLKADGSFTGIAFTGDSNPFCFVATGEDDICRGYTGYPVYGSETEAGGLFWPTHDGAAFTKAEATACGLPSGAYADYGDHLSDGIGRCRCYYDPNDAAKFVDVEIRYSSSLRAAMRLLEPQASDVTIPSGSRIVPIDTTTTWKSDLHIIMFGLNDSGVLKSADYWELIKEATDRIVADGGRYLVLMSQSASASRPKDWAEKMQTYFGDRYLDLYGKFTEKDANGDYKCFAYAEALGYTNVRTTELQQYAKIPITFSTDKLHPLEIGYDLMAHWVHDKLVELGEVEPEPSSGTAVPPAAKTRIRYDGAEKMGVDPGCGYTLSGHLATSAGGYEATATLKSGFTWNDGTTASKPIAWSIEKVSPVWVQCKIEPSTWEEGNPPETISLIAETREGASVTCTKTVDELKGLAAGKHRIAFSATETANYTAGTGYATITVTARMPPQPGEVAAPTAVTGLAYTGKQQTGVAAATGYTVTGGAATDAGDYTATATLADGYMWSDGTTEPKKIGWSIAKGVNTWKTNPSVSPATWAVDAVPETITIANGETAFGATVTCDTTVAALKALGEGDHTVMFTAAGTKNYDAITKTVTVTVTAGEVPGPGPTPGPMPVEELPEGYTAAAAVTSVNGDSVWFDTFHTPTPDTVSQIRLSFTKDGGAGLYGYLSPSVDDGTDYRLAATGGKWMLDLGDNLERIGPYGPAPACGTAAANVEHHLEIGNYYIKDLAADLTLASVEPVTFTRDYTLRIFGKQAGFAAYGSVASLKIIEKGTLVHDFVPCVSPDGVTGLFDLCTSCFHKPDGTFAKVEGGDEPAQKDPVVPGAEPKTYVTEELAKAAAPDKVTPPEDVENALKGTQALANYIACFTVATRQNGDLWVNVAELKPEAKAELQRQVDGGAAKVVDALAVDTVTLEPVTPGFRYALEYGDELGKMALQPSAIASDVRLVLPLPKDGSCGFYRVVVRETK